MRSGVPSIIRLIFSLIPVVISFRVFATQSFIYTAPQVKTLSLLSRINKGFVFRISIYSVTKKESDENAKMPGSDRNTEGTIRQ